MAVILLNGDKYMDNSYNEYRRQPRERRDDGAQGSKRSITGVIAVQLAVSLLVTALLFAVCRSDGVLSQNLKEFYRGLCSNDMTASEILGTFKKVAQFTFAPSTKWDGTFSPDEENSEDSVTEGQSEAATDGQGETDATEAGERAVFTPVFLTVNLKPPLREGNITSDFGYRVSPISGKYSLHTGLDIAAPEKSEIFAAYGGTVEKSDENIVRGKYVILRHSNSLTTTYNHCSKLLVKEGERVRTGERIALVGSTGASTGNHLHFEITVDGKYVNPRWVLFNEL